MSVELETVLTYGISVSYKEFNKCIKKLSKTNKSNYCFDYFCDELDLENNIFPKNFKDEFYIGIEFIVEVGEIIDVDIVLENMKLQYNEVFTPEFKEKQEKLFVSSEYR